MSDVHVVFGTGPIGRALVDELVARDVPVRTVSRSGADGLPAGVDHIAGDAADRTFVDGATADAAVLYQCLNPPYWAWAERFPPLQHTLVAAAMTAGARYVSFENVYMVGDTHGAPITEDLPMAPTTRKGTVRAAMAAELARLSAAGDLAVATARASDYFGPRATFQSPLGDQVIGRALAGKSARVVGDPDQPHSYTYAPDAARVMATLGADDRALGRVWHVPNAPARSTRAIVEMIGEALGRPIAVQPAPRWLLRLIGLFDRNVREIDEMLYEFTQPFVVDGAKCEQMFGVEATPLEEAIPATVAWWRSRG